MMKAISIFSLLAVTAACEGVAFKGESDSARGRQPGSKNSSGKVGVPAEPSPSGGVDPSAQPTQPGDGSGSGSGGGKDDLEIEDGGVTHFKKCLGKVTGVPLISNQAILDPKCATERTLMVAQMKANPKVDQCIFGYSISSTKGKLYPGIFTLSEPKGQMPPGFMVNDFYGIKEPTVMVQNPLRIALPLAGECRVVFQNLKLFP